ncbi:hypothetical protein K5E_25420 [Enterococcus thailandicus]|uniref:hypothetical protein n=1 Tax=Enterococcus thailandicus TaxID=417368 RepID=UPI00244D8D32|nr:hypothetical protein [Enterococcus thailandicus]GMC10403.1 hypothetical protein K5E_25420 [Enterococcus thailandicus]
MSKQVSIETLKTIINESKKDLTVDELLARANIDVDEVGWEELEVIQGWTKTLVSEALDAVLMRTVICASAEGKQEEAE